MFHMVRGGPVLHMAAASIQPITEWGRNSLLPLAASEIDTDEFCTSNYDNETAEKVSKPTSSVDQNNFRLQYSPVDCTLGQHLCVRPDEGVPSMCAQDIMTVFQAGG